MKEFKIITRDLSKLTHELAEFDALLASKPSLAERRELQPFFKKRDQLSAFLGSVANGVEPSIRLAFEFPFLGDFAADIIVGDRQAGDYVVIELEDAAPDSVFTKVRGKQTKEWSKRFDHGYSQLVDWFACLDDYRPTAKFIEEFGSGYINFRGLLVVGRSAGMTDGERRRLRWRSANVVVNSKSINCLTFDDLAVALRRRLELYSEIDKIQHESKK